MKTTTYHSRRAYDWARDGRPEGRQRCPRLRKWLIEALLETLVWVVLIGMLVVRAI